MSDTDVEDKLQAAVAEKPDSSTGTEEKVVADEKVTDDGMIPRSRYNDVSQQLKDSTTAWEVEKTKMGDSLTEAQTKVSELADAIAQSRSHTELVAALETLARDPKHNELIERVNLALAGKEYDVLEAQREDPDADPTQVDSKSIRAELRSEMEDALSEQRNEVILQQADLIAKDHMRQLPDDKYSVADKELIAELWANKVDWDSIESDPTRLGELLQDSLQTTLDRWETAHPALVASEDKETDKPDSDTEPSVEDQIGKILGRNWGAVKTDDAGKSVAEISESEFDDAFGSLFKKLNQQNG